MVDRLHVVLLSIVPAGAALFYLLWMYGWKKPKHSCSHHHRKPQAEEATDADNSESYNKVDSTCAEQLSASVNSEQDAQAERDHDGCSGMSISDDVSISPGSSSSDLKSLHGDRSAASAAAEIHSGPRSDLADVDSIGLVNDIIAAEVIKCHSLHVSEDTDRAAIVCQENGPMTLPEDDNNCCNGCIDNGEVGGESKGNCVRNNIATSDGCENDNRRDSIGSVST